METVNAPFSPGSKERQIGKSIMTLTDPEGVWNRLSRVLDDAMGKLSALDRDALVLRFFLKLSPADVGASLGMAEQAAQMRVTRALEKLRRLLAKRGLVLSTALIAGELFANSMQTTPAESFNRISSVPLAKGTTIKASTLRLVKETQRFIAWARLKRMLILGAGASLAAGIIALAAFSALEL